jgi:hypothetical protein
LETPSGFFQLTLQGVNLLGDGVEFFLCNGSRGNNLMSFAVGFAERSSDSFSDASDLVLCSHVEPPEGDTPSYTEDTRTRQRKIGEKREFAFFN